MAETKRTTAGSLPTSRSRSRITPSSSTSSLQGSSALTTVQHIAAVVIELGTHEVRVGLCGESHPRRIIPSSLPFPSAGSYSSFQLTETQWENHLYPLLSYILTDILFLKIKTRRIVVVEPYISPRAFRMALCRVLLVRLSAPGVLLVSGGMVSVPYALGSLEPTLVVDVGRWECRTVLVMDGRYLPDTFHAVPCGMDSIIKQILAEFNENSGTESESPIQITSLEDGRAIVRQCLESGATTTMETSDDSAILIQCDIPSTGGRLTLDRRIVTRVFHSLLWDVSNTDSLIYAFLSTLHASPMEMKSIAARRVCFVGGGAVAIPNLPQRMMSSIRMYFTPSSNEDDDNKPTLLLPSKMKSLGPALTRTGPLSIVHPTPFVPNLMAYMGASVLGTLSLSDERWVHRQAFVELDGTIAASPTDIGHGGDGESVIYDFLSMANN